MALIARELFENDKLTAIIVLCDAELSIPYRMKSE